MRSEEADFKPAQDFGVTVDGRTSWFLESEQTAINLTERDGVLFAALEDLNEALDE